MGSNKAFRHSSRTAQELRANFTQLSYPKDIRIQPSDRVDEIQTLTTELASLLDWFKNFYKKDVSSKDKEYLSLIELIGEICVGLWRSRSKMVDPDSGEPVDETKRALRPIENTLDLIRSNGFEIIDRTGESYVVGMLEKVVSWESSETLTKETIIETIRPTINYQNKLLKLGEIVVGTPPK